jgi:hypothetical protein
MASYTVTAVRREDVPDRTHRHIEGVCTDAGIHYTRREVVESLHAGDRWRTLAGGVTATITTTAFCPATGCLVTPYLRTDPDSSGLDNLENLPDC